MYVIVEPEGAPVTSMLCVLPSYVTVLPLAATPVISSLRSRVRFLDVKAYVYSLITALLAMLLTLKALVSTVISRQSVLVGSSSPVKPAP